MGCTGLVAYTSVFVPSLGQPLHRCLDRVTFCVLGVLGHVQGCANVVFYISTSHGAVRGAQAGFDPGRSGLCLHGPAAARDAEPSWTHRRYRVGREGWEPTSFACP